MTGGTIETCPWRGFSDKRVSAVLSARALIGDGSVTDLLADDPPPWIVDGLSEYQRVVNAITNHDAEQAHKDAMRRMGSASDSSRRR